jgi:hypothetical protein
MNADPVRAAVTARATFRAAFLSVATLLTVAACESTTAPNCPLDGTWAWEWNRNPSGSSLDLVLTTAGTAVSGAGVGYGVGPDATADSITVSGTYTPGFLSVLGLTPSHSGSVRLTLTYRSGRVVTYTAILACPNKLEGTATDGGSPYALVFYRGINPLPGPTDQRTNPTGRSSR